MLLTEGYRVECIINSHEKYNQGTLSIFINQSLSIILNGNSPYLLTFLPIIHRTLEMSTDINEYTFLKHI